MISDNFGRPVLNFRVSITQRCNLHCVYCHREGEERNVDNPVTEMTATEIVRLVSIAVGLGIEKVKLTGGEPLVRSDVLNVVKGIAELKGLKDLAMTTNGSLLADEAEALFSCGLKRVNINIPSLRPETYRRLTGGNLTNVLKGIDAAVSAGFSPVKLNMLVLRGINDGEIASMIDFASRCGAVLQLIELEPINLDNKFFGRHHLSLDMVESELKEKAMDVKTRRNMQNRRIYCLPNVKVEVIKPIENTEFCAHCTRLRLTSDGKLKPCLMRNDNLTDVLTPLRKGASDEELAQAFLNAIKRREPYFKRRE
ncbi:MAG: GTP 3',8-cyclase MoaA [Candidatus Bathyarchaeia archaeon]